MDGSLFAKLNKDKKHRQRAILVLCLVLVSVALIVYLQTIKVGVAMTDRTICGMEEHTHDEHCIADRVLMCEDDSHTHTDECYQTVWSCGMEEHTHTPACYPDHTADVESPETWEASLPALSGYPVSDIVRIAESQIGYTESARNVEFTELGDGDYASRGYTRYGAFADSPYCDNWSAAFVSFCLHYAGLTESAAPRHTDCGTMRQLWENAGAFAQPDAHSAQPGDLVFVDADADGTADRVGIVTFANAESVRAIVGNANETVEEIEIPLSDGTILGYGVTSVNGTPEQDPEPETEPAPDSEPGPAADSEPAPSDGGTAYTVSGSTSATSWTSQPVRKAAVKMARAKSAPAKSAPEPLRSAPTDDVPLDDYITGISAAGTTKIDDTHYLTMVELSFTIDPTTAMAVTESAYQFVFDLPEEIIILDDIIEGGPYNAYKVDSNPHELAFVYDFVPNGDGTFRIEVNFDEDYVQEALDSGSQYIINKLDFKCYINATNGGTENGLEIEFTADQTLDIPAEEINEDHDVSSLKTGSFTSDGKLRYEVTVSTVNGTPSTVALEDTFTYSGDGTVSAPTIISVVKHNANGTIEISEIPAQGNITSTAPNVYDIDLSLPQLDAGEYYTIVYEYAVTGLTDDDAAVSAYNSVEVTSSDDDETTSDTANYFIYKQQRKKIGKDGIPYEDYVQWNISVNDRGGDIAGKTVYDDSFADARNETINGTNGIVVQKGWQAATPGVDYEFVYGDGGEIIGVRFLPADASTPNTNTYHITYYTYPDVAYGETAIEHNDAEFDGDSAGYDVVVTGGDIEKTAEGDESIGNDLHTMNWKVTVEVPVGGIEAGTTFTDALSPVGHYLTQAQYNALVTAIQTAWGSTPVTVTPAYTGDNITGYTLTVGTAGNGCLLDDGYVDKIVWHYQTTGDMSGKATETFVNTFSDGEKTLTATNTISPNVKKLNARKISDWQTIFTEDPTSYTWNYDDDADEMFVWVVEVTPTPGLLQYRVTDMLPAGVELLGVKAQPSPLTAWNYGMDAYTNNLLTIAADGTISGEIGQLWFSKTMASGSVTTAADGRQVVDVILTANSANSDLFNGTFNVIYYCKLAEDAWPANGTVHLTLNNTVSVSTNDEEYGEAENEIIIDATHTEKVVDKAGSWDRDTHLITYTININPSAENLLTSANGVVDPEWLTLTDVLTYTAREGSGTGEAILNLNSVVLEKEVNGVWTTMHSVQWTARTETDSVNPDVKHAIIEMKIPDSEHLRLTYSYHVSSTMANGIMLDNVATVEGNAEHYDERPTDLEVEEFNTYGESDYEEFRLIKIDAENGMPLSGAVFTVYAWDGVNEEWIATVKSYTTDSEGKIVIKATDEYDDETLVYSKDTAYCIMETAAPAGYILPENPRPFYFWFSENEDAPPECPDDFMLTAADVSTSSHRIEAENQCEEDYVTETGVYGIKLLPSLVALLTASVGMFLIAWKIMRKKRYVH